MEAELRPQVLRDLLYFGDHPDRGNTDSDGGGRRRCLRAVRRVLYFQRMYGRIGVYRGMENAEPAYGKRQGDKEEIYWYDDHCEIVEEDITSRYSYTGIRKIKEEEKYIFLTFGGKVTVAIDKDEFRKGKPEKFIKFIEDARVDK